MDSKKNSAEKPNSKDNVIRYPISFEDGSVVRSGFRLYLKFSKPYKKKLEIRAFSEDGRELSHSAQTSNLKQDKDSVAQLDFSFPKEFNLSEAADFKLAAIK